MNEPQDDIKKFVAAGGLSEDEFEEVSTQILGSLFPTLLREMLRRGLISRDRAGDREYLWRAVIDPDKDIIEQIKVIPTIRNSLVVKWTPLSRQQIDENK